MTLSIAPFPVDLAASLGLAEEALRARLAPGEQLSDLLPPMASAIRTGRANGGLLKSEGSTEGIVVWVSAGPLGVALRLLHLSSHYAGPERYDAALALAERVAGPVVFAPGSLAGLTAAEESTLMQGRGFASYGRSEMMLGPETPVPLVPVPTGITVRPVLPSDEPSLARLHERAYEDHLDRYLALEEVDPARDADRQLRDYFTGRYGEILSPGSSVVAVDGRVVAAAISTHYAPTRRALIIDVMTDPDRQGTGLGRVVLSDAVRALRERGETSIVLNVTEGNHAAFCLYTRLGFIRSMGPTHEWYDARRIRVAFPRAGNDGATTPDARVRVRTVGTPTDASSRTPPQ
ncbi:MAG TPA: GNAT family N-acetyltransferase [Thermoplasmata archaeon]|nr:GNAT family N-acetyltransferase [Thermoplasmata archaeon]